MPAYLLVKVFKVLKIDTTITYNPDRSASVSILAENPVQLNWEIISAANKWEADGKAKESLERWLIKNKEQFDKDRQGANKVTEDTFVWEIDNTNAAKIINIMAGSINESLK